MVDFGKAEPGPFARHDMVREQNQLQRPAHRIAVDGAQQRAAVAFERDEQPVEGTHARDRGVRPGGDFANVAAGTEEALAGPGQDHGRRVGFRPEPGEIVRKRLDQLEGERVGGRPVHGQPDQRRG